MTIETSEQLISEVKLSLGSSSELIGAEGYEFVVSQALNELGWSLPVDGKKAYWAVQRGKRHCLDILRTQSAHKFRYKDLSLNHRFNHYNAMVENLDKKFEKALDTDPDLLDIADMFRVFGTYVENGFVYDQYGNDISKIMQDFGVDNEGYRYRIL